MPASGIMTMHHTSYMLINSHIHVGLTYNSFINYTLLKYAGSCKAWCNVVCTYICTILSQASAHFGVSTSPSHPILTVLWYNKILQVRNYPPCRICVRWFESKFVSQFVLSLSSSEYLTAIALSGATTEGNKDSLVCSLVWSVLYLVVQNSHSACNECWQWGHWLVCFLVWWSFIGLALFGKASLQVDNFGSEFATCTGIPESFKHLFCATTHPQILVPEGLSTCLVCVHAIVQYAVEVGW